MMSATWLRRRKSSLNSVMLMLGQPAQVGHVRRRDAQRVGERPRSAPPSRPTADRSPGRTTSIAVDQLLAQLGSSEASGQLGRLNRRQRVNISIDTQDHTARGLHQHALGRPDRTGNGGHALHRAQAQQGGGRIWLEQTHWQLLGLDETSINPVVVNVDRLGDDRIQRARHRRHSFGVA